MVCIRKILCEKCKKEFTANNFNKHAKNCNGPRRKKIYGVDFDPAWAYKAGLRTGWNKGQTKETDVRIALGADKRKESYKNGLFTIKHTDEGLKKLSENAKKNNLGGYRPHPNKGSRYKDIWFDSNWEIIVAKSLDENNIKWERPKTGFVWNDKGNKYYPDFYLPEYNVYLDPKNDYLIEKDFEKIEQSQLRNQIKVLILNKKQLQWDKIKELL